MSVGVHHLLYSNLHIKTDLHFHRIIQLLDGEKCTVRASWSPGKRNRFLGIVSFLWVIWDLYHTNKKFLLSIFLCIVQTYILHVAAKFYHLPTFIRSTMLYSSISLNHFILDKVIITSWKHFYAPMQELNFPAKNVIRIYKTDF